MAQKAVSVRFRPEVQNKHFMSREFNSSDLNYIANSLKESVNRMEYTGDISDLGNEIGLCIGSRYENMTQTDINELILGIQHGISLTNGTH
jgi:hypothetical protein